LEVAEAEVAAAAGSQEEEAAVGNREEAAVGSLEEVVVAGNLAEEEAVDGSPAEEEAVDGNPAEEEVVDTAVAEEAAAVAKSSKSLKSSYLVEAAAADMVAVAVADTEVAAAVDTEGVAAAVRGNPVSSISRICSKMYTRQIIMFMLMKAAEAAAGNQRKTSTAPYPVEGMECNSLLGFSNSSTSNIHVNL
jgi:hypothetical protein